MEHRKKRYHKDLTCEFICKESSSIHVGLGEEETLGVTEAEYNSSTLRDILEHRVGLKYRPQIKRIKKYIFSRAYSCALEGKMYVCITIAEISRAFLKENRSTLYHIMLLVINDLKSEGIDIAYNKEQYKLKISW